MSHSMSIWCETTTAITPVINRKLSNSYTESVSHNRTVDVTFWLLYAILNGEEDTDGRTRTPFQIFSELAPCGYPPCHYHPRRAVASPDAGVQGTLQLSLDRESVPAQ